MSGTDVPTPQFADKPRVAGSRLTRRQFLKTVVSGAATLGLATLARCGFAQPGADTDLSMMAMEEERRLQQAVRDTYAKYMRERAHDGLPLFSNFAKWNRALFDYADYDQVRSNLRPLLPPKPDQSLPRFADDWEADGFDLDFALTRVCSREFEVTWRITEDWVALSLAHQVIQHGGKEGVIWLPVPQLGRPGMPLAEVTGLAGIEGEGEYKTDRFGNRFLEVRPRPKEDVLMHATVTLEGVSYRKLFPGYDPGGPVDEARAYLGESIGDELVRADPDGPNAQAILRRLQRPNPLETYVNICLFLSHPEYLPPGAPDGREVSENCLEHREGGCEDVALRWAALLRAAGIPCRFVRGNSAIIPEQPYPLNHSNVDAYFPGMGWIQAGWGPLWASHNNFIPKVYQTAPGDETKWILLPYEPCRCEGHSQRMLREWL